MGATADVPALPAIYNGMAEAEADFDKRCLEAAQYILADIRNPGVEALAFALRHNMTTIRLLSHAHSTLLEYQLATSDQLGKDPLP